MQVGPVAATYVAGAQITPLTQSGNGATVSGLVGGPFTAVSVQPPSVLANTHLVYQYLTTPWSMAIDGSNPYQVYGTGRGQQADSRPSCGPDGRIAFCKYDPIALVNRIWVVNADGTGAAPITPTTYDAMNPRWSPNGARIAYRAYDPASNHNQIFTMSSIGTGVTRVSDGTTDEDEPAWSWDSSKLAFIRYISNTAQIFTMNATGGNVKQVTSAAVFGSGNNNYPAWSADGTEIVFSHYDGQHHHLRIITVGSSTDWFYLTQGTNDETRACFSPDGHWVAYDQYGSNFASIHVAHPDGSLDQVISTTNNPVGGPFDPYWSPYPGRRLFVGAGGSLSASSSGFLFGQNGAAVTSFVGFNAANPATTKATGSSTSTSNNIVFTVTADSLTSLKYVNGLFGSVQTAIPYGSLTTANGALVSFNSADGTVALVVPFVGTPSAIPAARGGGKLVYSGKFPVVLGHDGKNLAPGGASEIQIDPNSGRLIALR